MKLLKPLLTVFLGLSICGCGSNPDPKEASFTPPTSVETTSIEQQVLYEGEEVKLVAKSLEIKDSTSTLTLYALNNLNTTLQVEIYMSSINGFAIDPSTSIFNLNFLSETEPRITFYNDELLNHNIGKITDFEFIVNVYVLNEEFEIVNSFTSKPFMIKTDAYEDYKTVIDTSGKVIYDTNDIRIIAKEIIEGELTLYFENNSENKISLVYKPTDENNQGISYVANISNGKKAVRKVSVSVDKLEDLKLYIGIEDLDHSSLLDSQILTFKEN